MVKKEEVLRLEGTVVGCVDKNNPKAVSMEIKFCHECNVEPCNVLRDRMFIIKYPK